MTRGLADARWHRRLRRAALVVGFVFAVSVGALWFVALRPTGLGGPAGYIIVAGHSMEPTLVTGDLVITQRRSSYAVGDIVAFSTGGGLVIHRIVGGDAVRGYDVQGDSKERPDLWHPRPGQVVGSLWLHLPQAGTALALLRQPASLAAVSAALAFLFAFSWRRPTRLPGGRTTRRLLTGPVRLRKASRG